VTDSIAEAALQSAEAEPAGWIEVEVSEPEELQE
jgi:hypothetical protein